MELAFNCAWQGNWRLPPPRHSKPAGSTSEAVTSQQRIGAQTSFGSLEMFRLPAFDPVAISVVVAGILLIVVLILAY
jgi:hypothetical protein